MVPRFFMRCELHERCLQQVSNPSCPCLSGANLIGEKRRAWGRDRLAVCRTRSSHPWSLIGCSRQPVVLQTASQSLPETPITEIIRNYNYFRDEISSTEEFIEYAGTKSTKSGRL